MSAPTSTTSAFALGTQKLFNTAATTNFITGRMQTSSLNEGIDVTDPRGEHRGAAGRPTARQGNPIRVGYVGNFRGVWRLYPDLIGAALCMSGFQVVSEVKAGVTVANQVQTITVTASGGTFKVTFMGQTTASVAYNVSTADLTTALNNLSNIAAGDVTVGGTPGSSYTLTWAQAYVNKNVPLVSVDTSALTGGSASVALTTPAAGTTTVYYEHVFTLCDRANAAYGTVLESHDEGSSLWERMLKDSRFASLAIEAGTDGIIATGNGNGRIISASAGTEVKSAEDPYQLSQSTGTWSCTISSVELSATAPRGNMLTIAQELDPEDRALHSFYRGDVPIITNDITGQFTDLPISYNLYKKLRWGGTSGTGPTADVPATNALSWSFVTPGYMSGTSTAYSFAVSVPAATLELSDPEASGTNLIRTNVMWAMTDLTDTQPITITLKNLHPHYIGS